MEIFRRKHSKAKLSSAPSSRCLQELSKPQEPWKLRCLPRIFPPPLPPPPKHLFAAHPKATSVGLEELAGSHLHVGGLPGLSELRGLRCVRSSVETLQCLLRKNVRMQRRRKPKNIQKSCGFTGEVCCSSALQFLISGRRKNEQHVWLGATSSRNVLVTRV